MNSRENDYDGRPFNDLDWEDDDAIARFIGDRRRKMPQDGRETVDDNGFRSTRTGDAARSVLTGERVTGSRSRYDDGEYIPHHTRSQPFDDDDVPPRRTRSQPFFNDDIQPRSTAASSGGRRSIKIIPALLLAVVIIYYAVTGAAFSGIKRETVDTAAHAAPAESVADIPLHSSTLTVKNVLLLGIDDDGGSGSRSDTIMIASVDTLHRTVRLCSILRDNYVAIPGHEPSRINSAYAYGGAELTLQTVEANYRIDINDYVSVSMDALISVVDAVGGVTINISEAEAGQINRYSYSDTKVSAGEQLLDGKQAVCYARIRKIDSDFGRTSRQRTLLNAVAAKCRSMPKTELLELVRTVSPYLTTNMSSVELSTLALMVLPALGNEIGQMSLPVEGTYQDKVIRQMAVLVPDLPSDVAALNEFLYGE